MKANGIRVCRNCGVEYSTGGYKYCQPCRPIMARQRSVECGRARYAEMKAERVADRPWIEGATLVCWLEKECVACGQQKPRSVYRGKEGRSPDGLQAACRDCESRRRSCRWLFATPEQKRRAAENLRIWRRSEAGKAYRSKRPKNPDHENSYRKKRLERMAHQDDGTVSSALLRKEFARTHCPYCAEPMQTRDKQLDHMHPLALGGMHSACNVLVCCASCNGRKSNLPFVDWLDTLKPEQAKQCRALWVKRNGAPPEQLGMLLPDPSVVVRKLSTIKQRETKEAIAEARRARAAWFKRDAPDEWMAAWYEASGKPWNNPRLTEAERYRLKYNGNPAYKASQQAKVRRWKQANAEMVAAQQERHRARKVMLQCTGPS